MRSATSAASDTSHIVTRCSAPSFRDQVRRGSRGGVVAGELETRRAIFGARVGGAFRCIGHPGSRGHARAGEGRTCCRRAQPWLSRRRDVRDRPRRDLADPSCCSRCQVYCRSCEDHLVRELWSVSSKIADEIVVAAAGGDLIDYLHSDRRFHVALISQLGNVQAYRARRPPPPADPVMRPRQASRDGSRWSRRLEEHHELVETMRAGDGAATKRVISSHIKHVRGLWVGREET